MHDETILVGFCECGCGERTPIATLNRRGYRIGQPLRFVHGHNARPRPLSDGPNPGGTCMCGCGLPTSLARQTNNDLGHVVGKPMRYLAGHGSRSKGVPACGYVEEDRGHKTPCWIWRLGLNQNGYGRTGASGEASRLAHVALWIQTNGPVPNGLQLDHLCRVPCCVNPSHLEPVSNATNVQRGNAAKLNWDAVAAIRQSQESGQVLASRFGVNPRTVWSVRNYRSWR